MITTNRVSLIGNAVRPATTKTFDNGGRVANFSMATNERGFTTKSGIAVPDRTDFHNLVVKGGLVEVVEKYIEKGTKLCVVGVLRYRSYETNEGEKRTITEIHVKEIELLGKRVKVESVQAEPMEQQVVFKSTEEEDDLPF
ncbi:MAG: single-stranded DNA-binding protein [Rikenellaceae bacterium]